MSQIFCFFTCLVISLLFTRYLEHWEDSGSYYLSMKGSVFLSFQVFNLLDNHLELSLVLLFVRKKFKTYLLKWYNLAEFKLYTFFPQWLVAAEISVLDIVFPWLFPIEHFRMSPTGEQFTCQSRIRGKIKVGFGAPLNCISFLSGFFPISVFRHFGSTNSIFWNPKQIETVFLLKIKQFFTMITEGSCRGENPVKMDLSQVVYSLLPRLIYPPI